LGGIAGVYIAIAVAGNAFVAPPVDSIATLPQSVAGAFSAELLISGLLMLVVLYTGRSKALSRYTAFIVGVLLFVYITVEAPVSGMSMNPARTFASALAARHWQGIWIYFTAPALGMLLAAELFLRTPLRGPGCAKLVHRLPCIFCGQPNTHGWCARA
jgi:aquaporin Z